jgi:hypothetical protein
MTHVYDAHRPILRWCSLHQLQASLRLTIPGIAINLHLTPESRYHPKNAVLQIPAHSMLTVTRNVSNFRARSSFLAGYKSIVARCAHTPRTEERQRRVQASRHSAGSGGNVANGNTFPHAYDSMARFTFGEIVAQFYRAPRLHPTSVSGRRQSLAMG